MSVAGKHVVVIGGGIAGVSFLQTFASLCPDVRVTLISASAQLKAAHVSSTTGRLMQHLDVHEVSSSSLVDSIPNATFVMDRVLSLDATSHSLTTAGGRELAYSFACICTGARPTLIPGSESHVLSIRDTDSVLRLQQRLADCRTVVVVGNGGIASEFVFKVTHCRVVWIIREKSISSTFLDPVSAQFMLDSLTSRQEARRESQQEDQSSRPPQMGKQVGSSRPAATGLPGPASALGPDWCLGREFSGRVQESSLLILYETEVTCVREQSTPSSVLTGDQGAEAGYPVVVEVSSGEKIPCDVVISATGEQGNELQVTLIHLSHSLIC